MINLALKLFESNFFEVIVYAFQFQSFLSIVF